MLTLNQNKHSIHLGIAIKLSLDYAGLTRGTVQRSSAGLVPALLCRIFRIFKIITIPYYYSDYYSHSFKRLNRRKLNHEKSSTEKY